MYMRSNLNTLQQHISALCMLLALMFVPKLAQATDYYLVGGFNNWKTGDTYKFNVSDNSATLSLTGAQINAASTEFLIKAVESSSNSWFLKNSTPTTVTVDGDAVTASSSNNEKTANYTVSGLSTTAATTYTFTLTADGTDINHSKLKITSSTTGGGGGTSTTANQPGIYLLGEKFGATDPAKHLTYKFLRKNDSEYHFALYAGSMKFSVQKYEQNLTGADIIPSWDGWTFKLAYIDAEGNTSTFCPESNYNLTGTDGGASTEKNFGSNTQWTIQNNGGLYDLVVKVDANGKPLSWYYESDPNQLVSYKASSTSNWTTEGFLYCKKSTGATDYCNNFFGTVPMVKDEEFKFITGNYWLGHKYTPEEYTRNVAIAGTAGDAPNLKNPYDGIYPIEYNLTRTDYQLAGNDQTPLRIFMIGSALNSNLSNNFTDWDPANAIELVYDADEQCYKGTVSLSKNGQFRFLRDKNASGSATSLELNFGEDSNKPGEGGDTNENNHVAYNDNSTKGTNVVFNPETNTYNVRFYIEAGTDMSSFNWNSAKYRYTIELPTRLNATITPPSATVAYGASLTPKVAVVGTNADTRTYAYTLDGTDPVINTTTGKSGNNSTYIASYTYDPVVPTNDFGTYYMAAGNVLNFIPNDGSTTITIQNATSATAKVQAVRTITEGKEYRLEGNIATGVYTFESAGIQQAGTYTVTVTNNEPVSVNKAVATVEVKKDGVVDPDVDVYYTTDDTDPLYSASARIVRDRTITIYSKPGKVWNSGTIKVAIPNTTATASCNYDITYSTSEGGYLNYLHNDMDGKMVGGDGHVVVYVQPFDDKGVIPLGGNMKVFINAYEKLVDANGKVSYKSLTTAQQPLDKNSVISDPNVGENGDADWYYVDLVPTEGYKEINVTLGYVPEDELAVLTQATVANVCKDIFLRYDLTKANGQITDVTYQHTLGEHFYTTGDGVTKTEPANPGTDEHFFYAQVPLAWVSGNNTLKVYNGNSELTGATLTKQNGAETSDYSCVYKVKLQTPTSLEENTELTLKPNNGTKDGSVSWTIKYQNGGYYFYESASHYSTIAPLVFSQDNDETKDDVDMRMGFIDTNKTSLQTSDYTCALNPTWKSSNSTKAETTTVSDNWNGNEATVNVIPKGTTISQTPVYSFYSESDNSEQDNSEQDNNNKCVPVTVQMIVRGENGAKATLKLQSINSETKETASTVTATKSFSGYDSQGTVTTDGRVESLLTDTKNGWQKLEATLTPTAEEDGNDLSISLTAEGGALQLSDVTLLEAANTDGHVWTTAPTNSTTTEYDLSKRSKANAYSFFDRGENKNAIIYANVNTVVGMSKNTYDVAAATPVTTTSAKAAKPRRATGGGGGTGSGGGPAEPTEYTYSGGKLVLYDNVGSTTSQHSWGTSKSTTWASFTYDRKFYGTTRSAGTRNTICLPFGMDQNQITSIFGSNAKIYQISSFDKNNRSVVYGDKVTSTSVNKPYVLEITGDDKDGVSLNSQITTEASPEKADDISTSIGEDTNPSYFVGVYSSSKRIPREDNDFTYYVYDADKDGIFRIVSTKGANVKPFRAYLKVRKSTSAAKPFYFFKVNDNTTTAIDEVTTDTTWSSNAPVYNLQGQMVRRAGETTSLPKGIYIQNGRKFIQK